MKTRLKCVEAEQAELVFNEGPGTATEWRFRHAGRELVVRLLPGYEPAPLPVL